MKAYKAYINSLQALTKEEVQKQLEAEREDIRAFIPFLEEIAEDTSDPEAYTDLLYLLTAYSLYGLELIAEKIGIELQTISTDDYKDAVAIIRAEEEEQLTS